MTDRATREAREKVAGMTRAIGYALAVAGLFVWLFVERPMIGIAMILAGAGDIVIAAFLRRRLEREDRGGSSE
ncbi:MAG: hypothetical protein JSW21_10185 [Gammaproteobacteria bacterium]|jgi:preprotein translocase subunit SecF|nr:MAG: hypothetical protein JSW21_10185 [Gammaproteobacteria bacterium]